MGDVVQVKARIPRVLKRRAFAAFALREEKFNRWLRLQMESWLQEVEEHAEAEDITESADTGADRHE